MQQLESNSCFGSTSMVRSIPGYKIIWFMFVEFTCTGIETLLTVFISFVKFISAVKLFVLLEEITGDTDDDPPGWDCGTGKGTSTGSLSSTTSVSFSFSQLVQRLSLQVFELQLFVLELQLFVLQLLVVLQLLELQLEELQPVDLQLLPQ